MNYIREAFKKKMSQKVEKGQKGRGGSAPKIKKSKIRNLDFLIRGGNISIFFPLNVNVDAFVERKVS